MAESSKSESTTQSTYRFWRSQHRPMDDTSETRGPREIVTEATCNRFGEELGQRLESLVWPQVPDVWKDLFGKVGGRVAPLYLLFQRLFGSKAQPILEQQPSLSLNQEEILAHVHNLMSDPDWKSNIISEAMKRNPQAEGDTLRDLVIKLFSAQVLEKLGLQGSYQLQKNDPQSLTYLVTLLVVMQELNKSDL